METIIIDENYEGVTKRDNFWYEFNGNLEILGNVVININLIVKGYQRVEGEMNILGLKTKFSLSFIQENYQLYFMSNLIKIGCQKHSPQEWENFTDKEISNMDSGALEWWKKWKKFVLSTHSNLVEVYGEV